MMMMVCVRNRNGGGVRYRRMESRVSCFVFCVRGRKVF